MGSGVVVAGVAEAGLLGLGDLVTDDTADRRSGCCSKYAAAEHVTRGATDGGTSDRTLILRGHSGTSAQSNQDCGSHCTD